ncbi:MAG TPA: aspartate aminotransferase, partial [Acidobacteria bacterium]|nr:aspartate aminotransferase [Acidobacteriota bacterium]
MRKPLPLAERLERVSASQTQEVILAVEALRREGVDVIDLGAGEPDFPTPAHIRAAAVEAIEAGHTKYTAGPGILALREAIARHYTSGYGVPFDPAEIVVTSGGKQALFNVAVALFGPGDEVITHTPGWPSIVEQIHLAGADAVLVRTSYEEGFDVRADAILEAVTPRTRGIVLNSPGNPTGAVISETELAELCRAIAGRDIRIILDLCYEQLIHDRASHNLPAVLNDNAPGQGVLVGSA